MLKTLTVIGLVVVGVLVMAVMVPAEGLNNTQFIAADRDGSQRIAADLRDNEI